MNARLMPRGMRGAVNDDVKHVADTFCEWVHHWARVKPDCVSNYWLDQNANPVLQLTFSELWNRSTVLAQWLTSAVDGPQLRRGDRALIIFPVGLEFLPALLACLRVGVIAVSTYPPNPSRVQSDLHTLQRVAEDCGGRVALTTAAFVRFMRFSQVAGDRWPEYIHTWIPTDDVGGLVKLTPAGAQLQPWQRRLMDSALTMPTQDSALQPDDLCMLQYTSGSTGNPKGVMVSRSGLAYMTDWMATRCEATCETHACVWAPQYHDMGLIGGYLSTIRVGCINYNMSPIDFLRNPVGWLTALQRYKIHVTTSPNFGWALAMGRARDQSLEFDLSCITHACMGGEPTMAEVQAAMISQLRIDPQAIDVHYGCAEMVLDICCGGRGFHPRRGVASCGSVSSALRYGSRILIVDPETRLPVPDGEDGVILAQSPAKCLGYFEQPALSARRFQCVVSGREGNGFWYDTRDLGFIDNDQLYVLGRQDDVIIVNGRNIFPTDIECLVNQQLIGVVRPGSTVAVQTLASGISVVVECRPSKQPTGSQLQAIAALIEDRHSVLVAQCIAVAKGGVPRTTSGKVRRKAVKAMVLQHSLMPLVVHPATSGSDAAAGPGTTHGDRCDADIDNSCFSADAWRQFCLDHAVADMSATLIENGIDSLRLQRFVDAARMRFGIHIDPAFAGTKSAAALPLMADAADAAALRQHDTCWQSPTGIWWGQPCTSSFSRAWRQTFGVLIVVNLMAVCSIPLHMVTTIVRSQLRCYGVSEHASLVAVIVSAVISWMASFTVVFILAKWLVVGRYTPVNLIMWSWPFWRWWLVDRIADVWMTFVGSLIKDTPYLNMVYWLLGANCPIFTCRLMTPIREWDLFTAGEHTRVCGTVLLRCVNQRGVWLAPVTVPTGYVVEAHHVLQPGQHVQPQTSSDKPQRVASADPFVVQRLMIPLVSLACFATGIAVGSWATYPLVDTPAIRWFVTGVVSSAVAVALSIVLCRIRCWPVLADRVCQNSLFVLLPWIDWTATGLLWRLYGARIGAGTAGKLGSISPSNCHRLVTGAACLVPFCYLSTDGGSIVLEDAASIGLGACVQGPCRLRANCRVFPMSVVIPGTAVDRDALLMDGRCIPNLGNIGLYFNSWRLVALEVLHWFVTAAVRWIPLGLAVIGVGHLAQYLDAVATAASWPVYTTTPAILAVSMLVAGLSWSVLHILTETCRHRLCERHDPEIPALSLRCSVWINLAALHDVTHLYIKPFINGSMWINALLWASGAQFQQGGITETVILDRGIREAHRVTFGRNVVVDGGNVAGHVGTPSSLRFQHVVLGNNSLICHGAYVFQSVGANVTVAPRSVPFSRLLPNFHQRRVFVGAPATLVPAAPPLARLHQQ